MGASDGKLSIKVTNIRTIQVGIYWDDGRSLGTKYFNTVQELAEFLKDQPEMAARLGYVPKKK